MASVNRVILVGNLGADPELKTIPGGSIVCEFRIATTESWKDKNGDKHEETEWTTIKVWGKQAEACGKYLSKGRQVYVEGKLKTRTWEKDGAKHYRTEVVASDVKFLGGGKGESGGRGAPVEEPSGGGSPQNHGGPGFDDDLPFTTSDLQHEPHPMAWARRWP